MKNEKQKMKNEKRKMKNEKQKTKKTKNEKWKTKNKKRKMKHVNAFWCRYPFSLSPKIAPQLLFEYCTN